MDLRNFTDLTAMSCELVIELEFKKETLHNLQYGFHDQIRLGLKC